MKGSKIVRLLFMVFLSLVVLIGCESNSETIQLGSLTDYEGDKERHVEESLTEKERLDREYRQTKYVEGYDELHDESKSDIFSYCLFSSKKKRQRTRKRTIHSVILCDSFILLNLPQFDIYRAFNNIIKSGIMELCTGSKTGG